MRLTTSPIIASLVVFILAGALAAIARADEDHPPREPVTPVEPQALERAIDRGLAFLIESQNPDGSWGSARRTKGLNIYAPVPGSHDGFRAAITAMCVSAIIETGAADHHDAARAALERGEQWLFENLDDVRRANGTAVYNVWAHAYALAALIDMRQRDAARHADGPDRRDAIDRLIKRQIDLLRRYEYVGGGWGYYNFGDATQRPSGSATSFTTATTLIALREAKDAGFDLPDKLSFRAVRTVQRQRNPDGTYLYSANFHYYRGRSINQPGGSLGRSQVCNAALRLWGDDRITDAVIDEWLTRLIDRNGWLDIGRKRPVPHESWYAVAGYFYYYGHYYAARCIDLLPPDKRPFHQHRLARTIIALQEKDGSWWDYPFYNYHQPYGTAFALMTLTRCRPLEADDN